MPFDESLDNHLFSLTWPFTKLRNVHPTVVIVVATALETKGFLAMQKSTQHHLEAVPLRILKFVWTVTCSKWEWGSELKWLLVFEKGLCTSQRHDILLRPFSFELQFVWTVICSKWQWGEEVEVTICIWKELCTSHRDNTLLPRCVFPRNRLRTRAKMPVHITDKRSVTCKISYKRSSANSPFALQLYF